MFLGVIGTIRWNGKTPMAAETPPIDLSHIRLPPLERRKRIPMRAIYAVAKAIAEHFEPEKIILFGSYAYGQPRPSSDVDLLIVIETDLTPREQRLAISRALSPKPFGIDIIARTSADLELRIAQGDYFLRDIVRKGKVIYERRRRRVG